MTSQADKIARFRELHVPGRPLVVANPWDVGTAKLLVSAGFAALATTSSGHAATLGRLDGGATRDEVLAHAAELVSAVEVPVSADLENGFGHTPEAVAATVTDAAATGLAGCSIEDYTGDPDTPFYDLPHAVERIEAARAASDLVLTARAENFIRGNRDLADTIARLQAFQEAGADVLYAPGVSRPDDLRSLLASVDRPVNVLVRPDMVPVAQLAEWGVARISVGGAFNQAMIGALHHAARELLDEGTYGFLNLAAEGRTQIAKAFG
ncbi:isocitrate lyase/PEP mutase family protein [Pseudonocardia spinosispora]|uniref:isocitrate lyase/PEP mutase family protein n=1 Tax=Pseudonocardia spinosispora TaxID=103441 RepID=UPI00048D7270|nr:isocitrate lyase/phosphoenolpyruvate mutase family protein [Pseudonocardia spinosispora]